MPTRRTLRSEDSAAEATSADRSAPTGRRSDQGRHDRPVTVDRVSCTMAIDDDPAHRLVQRLTAPTPIPGPAGLHPEQRGNRLQVVLHPMVDLPDGGVLGLSSARSRRRTSVTSRTSTSAPDGPAAAAAVAAPGKARWRRLDLHLHPQAGLRPCTAPEIRSIELRGCRTDRRSTGGSKRPVAAPRTSNRCQASRWYADRAFGLTYTTRPSASSRSRPSPARGPVCISPGFSCGGKVPSATI